MRGGRKSVTRAREAAEIRRDGILARREKSWAAVRLLTEQRMMDCGLDLRDTAERAGLKTPTLSRFLNGGGMDQEHLTKLCGALEALRPHAVNARVLREAEALAATG